MIFSMLFIYLNFCALSKVHDSYIHIYFFFPKEIEKAKKFIYG